MSISTMIPLNPIFIGSQSNGGEISQGVQAPQLTTLYKTTSGSPPTIITNLAVGLQESPAMIVRFIIYLLTISMLLHGLGSNC